MKPIHPNRFVSFLRAHVQVNPATVLQSYAMGNGEIYTIGQIPESRTEYAAGQVLTFGSVNAAKDFVKALNADNPGVCRIGR